MFEHMASGTVMACVATGALIVWLDSRNERITRDSAGRGQFSLFAYDNNHARSGTAPTAPAPVRAAPAQEQRAAPLQERRAAQAPSVAPDAARTDAPPG